MLQLLGGLALLLLLFPNTSLAVGPNILINSFRVAGTKSTDEFVEIANVGTETKNIQGWHLAKKTISGTKNNLLSPFPSVEIRPGESVIAGHLDSTEPTDLNYNTGSSIAENNTIVLYSDDGNTVVDLVGFGGAKEFEGVPLPPAADAIWQRKNGVDTGNNAADFTKRNTTGTVDLSGLCISELMPAPSEGEEWIEIYNSEAAKDIGGLVIADKLGSVKKYTVPAGTVIDEGQYLVFDGKKTGISLNNDGDGAIITDPGGNIIDDTGESYGPAPIGFSWASDGITFRWSKTPTPGARNIITLDPVGETITSKKRAASSAGTTAGVKKGPYLK